MRRASRSHGDGALNTSLACQLRYCRCGRRSSNSGMTCRRSRLKRPSASCSPAPFTCVATTTRKSPTTVNAPAIEEFMVQHAERDAIADVGRPGVLQPMDVGGLNHNRHIGHADVQPTHSTLIAIGPEHCGAESWVPRLRRRETSNMSSSLTSKSSEAPVLSPASTPRSLCRHNSPAPPTNPVARRMSSR